MTFPKRRPNKGNPAASQRTTAEPEFRWLACADCHSTVHRELYGTAPEVVLSVETEHSPTCPAEKTGRMLTPTREVHCQFGPAWLQSTGFLSREEVEQR